MNQNTLEYSFKMNETENSTKKMTIANIAEILNGKILCNHHLASKEIDYAFASDLMSDVLTLKVDNMVVLTGLCNIQVIRTAEVSDASCIVFVRNKKATEEMMELAADTDLVLVECPFSMYKSSGMLYSSGLKPVY